MINYFCNGFAEEKTTGRIFRFNETEEIDFIGEMKCFLAERRGNVMHFFDGLEPFTMADIVSVEGQRRMDYLAREIIPFLYRGDNEKVIRCLALVAQLRPMLISSLDIHHYNMLVLVLMMGQEYRITDGLVDLIRASERYTFGNLIDDRLAQVCRYGVDNEDFCGWITEHWEQCRHQKNEIRNFMKKTDTGKYKTLYRLANPRVFNW